MDDAHKQAAIGALNQILELELAGVVKYTHYGLMVYGYNRIPIVSWFNGTGQIASLIGVILLPFYAERVGKKVTLLGGHPSLKIGALLETHEHDIGAILRESLNHEQDALNAYNALLAVAEGHSVLLEEFAREMIVAAEMHLDEVNKMLRRPGETAAFTA